MENSERRDKTRAIILRQASEMFVQKGIRAVRMDDIAVSLRISKRTLYEIYDNKKELLSDVMRLLTEETHRQVAESAKNCDNVMDILVQFFRIQADVLAKTNPSFFLDLKRYPELFEEGRREHMKYQKEAVAFFERGKLEGYFAPHINYELFCLLGSNIMADLKLNSEYEKYSVTDIFNTVIYALLRGLCTQKGIERLDAFVREITQKQDSKTK